MQNLNDPSPESLSDTAPSADAADDHPRSRRGSRTRARILDAAEEVFGRRGYHGGSIGEITRRAGVGLGTFYLYFPSKMDIYRHLLRSRQAEFIEVSRRAAEGAQDQRTAIAASFRAFFEWMSKRPAIMRMLREAEFVDPSLIEDLYKAPADEYRDRLLRAMELGYIERTDADVLAWCLMGMAEFATMRWIVWAGSAELNETRYRAFVEIMARAVGAPSPAPGHE